jgi:PAS domain S-box-containing protein
LQSLGEAEGVLAILAYSGNSELWVESSIIELATSELVLAIPSNRLHQESLLHNNMRVTEFVHPVPFPFIPHQEGPPKTQGWIRVILDRQSLEARLTLVLWRTLGISALTMVMGGGLVFVLLRQSLKVVTPLTKATQLVASGQLDISVPVFSNDELGQLASGFNQMTERLYQTTVSKEYLDSILRSMLDCLIVLDNKGIIQSMNHSAEQLLGFQRDELIGQHIGVIFPPTQNLLTPERMNQLLKEGSFGHAESSYQAKQGALVPILFSAVTIKKANGTIQGIACLAQDITERKKAQAALEKVNARLKELDQSRSQFYADISHELRTPLTVIRGEAEVTLRGKDKPILEYKTALEHIVQLTEEVNKLVNDLLFLARSETGTIQITKTQLALEKLSKDVLQEALILARKKHIMITLRDPPSSIPIYGDPQRLKQLFLILLDNAIKYSDPKTRVNISLEADSELAKVVITDNGRGIPEEDLQHVFKRFYRVRQSDRGSTSGAGLGLAIAKWIVESHQGKISMISTPGSGTTVTILLSLLKST